MDVEQTLWVLVERLATGELEALESGDFNLIETLRRRTSALFEIISAARELRLNTIWQKVRSGLKLLQQGNTSYTQEEYGIVTDIEFWSTLLDQIITTDQATSNIRTGVYNNYKHRLHEMVRQRFNTVPAYRISERPGYERNHLVRVEVTAGSDVLGFGIAKTMKEGEAIAARYAIDRLTRVP